MGYRGAWDTVLRGIPMHRRLSPGRFAAVGVAAEVARCVRWMWLGWQDSDVGGLQWRAINSQITPRLAVDRDLNPPLVPASPAAAPRCERGMHRVPQAVARRVPSRMLRLAWRILGAACCGDTCRTLLRGTFVVAAATSDSEQS